MVLSRRFILSSPPSDGGDEFVVDPSSFVQQEAATLTREEHLKRILSAWVPKNSRPEGIQRVEEYLRKHPVNECIDSAQVFITHVQDPDSLKDVQMRLGPMSVEEALGVAKERGMDLVQVAAQADKSFCRVRHERRRILQEFEEALKPEANPQSPNQQQQSRRASEQCVVEFRDVANDHFLDWRSTKIVDDLARGHPVRLTIAKFASPNSAAERMQKMLQHVEEKAAERKVWHTFTSVEADDRHLSVSLGPSPNQSVRHPTPKEWGQILAKFSAACRNSGRDNLGTYKASTQLKRRNVGVRQFRVDKFGRRLD